MNSKRVPRVAWRVAAAVTKDPITVSRMRPVGAASKKTRLCRATKRDSPWIGGLLADAFQADRYWTKLLDGVTRARSDRIVGACCEASVMCCRGYGEVDAASEDVEGVFAWVPGDQRDLPASLAYSAVGVRRGARRCVGATRDGPTKGGTSALSPAVEGKDS